MTYKIKAKLGKRVKYSKPYKSKSKALQVAKRDKELYRDMKEQYPKGYKRVFHTSKTPTFTVEEKR